MAEVLTVSEAARVLDVSAQTVRAWADRGMLPVLRTSSGQRIFQQRDVEELKAARLATADSESLSCAG